MGRCLFMSPAAKEMNPSVAAISALAALSVLLISLLVLLLLVLRKKHLQMTRYQPEHNPAACRTQVHVDLAGLRST